jgi:uncharacterized protein YukE
VSNEQHKQDLERATNQNDFADVARVVENTDGGGMLTRWVIDPVRAVVGSTAQGKAVFGSTDFGAKNLDLNEMVDLVEQTNPEDLESSGKALWDARDAIKAAADELRGRIERVKWKGEAGSNFGDYGRSLVKSADEVSEFAGKAGDQISAAAVGLASVRKAMPARDPRNLKRPEKFTDAEKTAKKDDYDAAVKVEKDRQEAINQMNRLASYYAVSSQQLSVLQEQPPTFRSLPTMGMPPVRGHKGADAAGGDAGSARSAATTHHAPVESRGRSGVDGVTETPVPQTSGKGAVAYPDDAVGTTIDSVGTLPPTTTGPVTGNVPPVTGTPPTTGGQPGPFGNYAPTVPGRTNGKTTGGNGGTRTPLSAQGRTQPGPTNSVNGRTTGPGATNQLGRPTATGQSTARGTGSGAKPFPMGQSGVHGGTPRSSGTAGPRANVGPVTGAGRANGVVGGRPATTGGAAARGGPKVPRGTVVGVGPSGARPATGSPGQRGVFGAPQTGVRPGAGTGGPARGGATGPTGPVTGNPAGRNSAAQAERNGMTRGGAGLVRRPGKGKPAGEREAQGSQRSDVVEDAETHLPDKPRRDVPPVVN